MAAKNSSGSAFIGVLSGASNTQHAPENRSVFNDEATLTELDNLGRPPQPLVRPASEGKTEG
jgi:hypothetical protein